MSTVINDEAVVFTRSFIDLLHEYHQHPESLLQVQRQEFGQVMITFAVDRKADGIARRILTPDQLNPVGIWGHFWWSMVRTVPASRVIWNLFARILGMPCGMPWDLTSEETTLHSVLRLVPGELQKSAAAALGENILICQVVDALKIPPDISVYRNFCDIEVTRCIFFQDQHQLDLPAEGLLISWLEGRLGLEMPGAESRFHDEPHLGFTELADDRGYLVRAIALGMSHTISDPVCRLLAGIFQDTPQKWHHRFSYEVHLNRQLVIAQHCISQLQAFQTNCTIVWTVTLHFDERMCPQAARCELKDVTGVPDERAKELALQFSGEWRRTVLGDVEALFHRPDPRKFMEGMIGQARLFQCRVQKAVVEGGKEDLQKSSMEIVSPNLISLLRLFSVPKEVRDRAFVPGIFENYLRGRGIAPGLIGVLIAVSTLPFEEVVTFIEHTYPTTSAVWLHKCSQIEIDHNGSEGVVIHRARSILRKNCKDELVLSWVMRIHLSQHGYPDEISLDLDNGHVSPLQGGAIYLFAPPPHPLFSNTILPTYHSPVREGYISTPEQGIMFNGSLLNVEPGREAAGEIYRALSGQTIEITPEVLRYHPFFSMSPHMQLLRSFISGFSSIPIATVVGFLHRIRPLKVGEMWHHKDRAAEIKTNIDRRVVWLRRIICSEIRYQYKDLFKQDQACDIAVVIWEMLQEYDDIGQPQNVEIRFLEQRGAVPELMSYQGSWYPNAGYGVDEIFRFPPANFGLAVEVSRLQSPGEDRIQEPLLTWTRQERGRRLFGNPAPYRMEKGGEGDVGQVSLIRVFEDGMQIIDKDNRPGLVQLVELLGGSKELQEVSRDQGRFLSELKKFNLYQMTWRSFLEVLKLPIDFPYIPSNEPAFLKAWDACCITQIRDLISFFKENHFILGLPRETLPNQTELLQVWSQQRVEKFLYLLGLAGGQIILANMVSPIEFESGPAFDVGVRWQHRQRHLDVNFLGDNGFEVAHLERSVRLDDAGKELASIAWSITMKLGASENLEVAYSSVDEIHAPGLTQASVEQLLTNLTSIWDCQHDYETVCPVASIDRDLRQKGRLLGRHYLLKIPGTIVSAAADDESLSALCAVIDASFDLNKILPATEMVARSLAKEDDSKYCNAIEASLNVDDGGSNLCYTIVSIVYQLDCAGEVSHFHRVASVPWTIQFSLDSFGRVLDVSVLNGVMHRLSEAVVQECVSMLRAAYRLDHGQRVYFVSRP